MRSLNGQILSKQMHQHTVLFTEDVEMEFLLGREGEREREKDVHNTHELGASHIEVCLFRAIKLVPEVKYFQLTKLDVEVSVCAVVPTQA